MELDDILTVSEFNEVINVQLQTIGAVSVVGEITEKHITRNSGLMMTIKDDKENAILKLSGFVPRIKGINSVDVGMKIVAHGVPQLYSPYGSFSLNIFSVVPYGEGSLKAAFEKLKALLEAKGFFQVERKRQLPEFVTKIALITADGSAAYTDFMKILSENESSLDIDFYPVSVQGKNSVSEIINAFDLVKLNQSSGADYDCVVLTRGGGSLEDLISFNSEEVAEAVFACPVPVISAVGHERDTSISDMVADIVASTPSQAAYYLAVHNNDFIGGLEENLLQFIQILQYKLKEYDYSDKLNFIEQKLLRMIDSFDYSARLELIGQKISSLISSYDLRSKRFASLLDSYDPRKVLKRGYSIVRSKSGVVTSVKQVKRADKIDVQMSDGNIGAIVESV